ncbi:fimbrial assembly protein [Achromobacter sp. SD115]|uniref:fimbrial assembly protein n=1 Tax=Achromobacter sp. SD115 TaxID=2782011 RepID=UPI001A95FFBE|nr:fimbrial assembly protein [Achromobacter sp. SD115]MBO1016339.1 fimbrial assembly protein [Achromobacter sp. SD115]
MKLNKILIVMGLAGAFAGAAHAANPISKAITLTAQIHDALYVSKPDGTSWYSNESLEPTSSSQQEFTKTLPIRVWSKSNAFTVALVKPFELVGTNYTMRNTTVSITHANSGGTPVVISNSPQKVGQGTVNTAIGAYDDLHDLKISVKAPTPTPAGNTNGSYSGDLVLMFEPA